MSSEAVVSTNDLTKRYGEFVALDSLTMEINRGQILGFIGPNGAGKTTTIKILVGLSKPTSGTASIAGHDCERDARAIKRLVGYMPDTFGSYDNMRVREYLDFFGAAFRIPRKQRKQRIAETLDLTGSEYMKDRYVDSLSHGMKQRVAVARTMLHDPEVLILDEPANGLDPNARIEMRNLLLRLADIGKTLIVTSHILPELSRICDTVAMITHGKLRAFGTLEDIMKEVNQRRSFEVQLLKKENVHRCAELVRHGLGENTDVEVSEAESIVRFTTDRSDQILARLNTALGERSLGVVQFREVVQSLEDAFLSVTKSEMGSGDRPSDLDAIAKLEAMSPTLPEQS